MGAVKRLWPQAALLGLILLTLAVILDMTGGGFSYGLDDPYIHLALSENIARGFYGLGGAPAAPSSSILWPFLLAPAAGTALHPWLPLILNGLCALALLPVIKAILHHCRPARPYDGARVLVAALALNVIGLTFSGMEHVLQMLLALAAVLGLLTLARDGRLPWWLGPAIVAGPLVRYESVTVSAAALAALWLYGHRRAALAWGAATLLPLAGFSLFLLSRGLPPLPSSVLAKTRGRIGDVVALKAGELLFHPGARYALAVLLLLLLTAVPWRRLAERDRPLWLFAVIAAVGHLLAGHYALHSFSRYEPYQIAAITAAAAWLWRGGISVPRRLLLGLVALPLIGLYGSWTLRTPRASENIYQQQYQMHRFAADFLRGPVAVNDLGWVAFDNPYPVLDLWGLGNDEARTARQTGDRQWPGGLVARHGSAVVMVYSDRIAAGGHLPADWRLAARLYLGGPAVTPAGSIVDFYATPAADAARLDCALDSFAATLPPGVRLERL